MRHRGLAISEGGNEAMNTTYFLNLVAGNIFKTKTNPAVPSKMYLGFSKTTPNLAGGNVTEPTGNGYARVPLNSLGAPSNGLVSNTEQVEFAESTAAWGMLTHYVVYDAATGGNLLMYGELSSTRTVEGNTVMFFKAGELKLSVVNPT